MEEDTIALILEWIHITTAFIFTVGVFGYYLTVAHAAKEKDVKVVKGLMALAIRFEKYFILPGEAALLLAGLFTAWRENVPILGFLQGGDVNWLLVALILFLSRFPLIMLITLPHEKLLNKKLEEALSKGQVTRDLRKVFADKTAKFVEIYGLGALALIIFLMVMKPF
jgi:hypothetical protein